MKKYILFLITLLSAVLLNAQSTQSAAHSYEAYYKELHGGLSNEDFFNQSELVIEGKMLKIVDTYDTKGNGDWNDMYSILPIKVQRVYKGDPSLTAGDTVYTVCKKSEVGKYFPCYPREVEYQEIVIGDNKIKRPVTYEEQYMSPVVLAQNGIKGGVCFNTVSIFFLATSDLPDSREPKYASHKKYKFLHNEDSRLWVWNHEILGLTKILGLNNLFFDNHEELYSYMKQFEGYIVPIARVE